MNEAEVKEVVRHTVPEVLSAYGVDVTDPQEAQADMAYLRRRRIFDEKFTPRARWTLGAALITSVVSGIFYLMKEIFRTGS